MSEPFEGLEDWVKQVGTVEAMISLLELFSDLALFIVDSQRQILAWNKGAERLLGYSKKEVLGEHCRMISRCHECMIGCPIATRGKLENHPMTLYRKDGSVLEIARTAIAFFDKQNAFAGGIEILAPLEKPAELTVEKFMEEEIEVFEELLTRDKTMKDILRVIVNIAEREASVHIHGESGTGKELVARAIHNRSLRKEGPFVVVNCGALTPTLLESELFGHEKGAFTGAIKKHVGLFQQADGGTIFLDEIAELPVGLQPKLLRVLESREITPVGGSGTTKVNIRILSATHKSLKKLTKEGNFREDLMYRLRVIPISLPPLRKRPSDIEPLIWHFIQRYNESGQRIITGVAPQAMRLLLEYQWPGNVRELKNVIEYAFAVGRGTELLLEELPLELLENEIADKIPETTHAVSKGTSQEECELIRSALQQSEGNVGKAAEILGISRPTLWRKRKKYGL